MHPLPIDHKTIDQCRDLAAQVAAKLQAFIDGHTTVSIERTVLGAYGIDGGIQRIGQTTCARFVHMFFQAVDPEMPLTRIDNEIRALLRFRNNAKQRA